MINQKNIQYYNKCTSGSDMMAQCIENDNLEKVFNVIKSENDDQEYKLLMLKNKMKILLISDPSSEKSAASLNVNVGHSSDPDSVPGIAHFCEHMLFLGTVKYPVEGEYNEFLSQNGGRANAYTSGEFTNYHFDVKSEAFFPALDRFAHFFLSPLFNADSTDRELHAIDSEHQKNILNDHRRKYFINKSTAKLGHVYQKFGTGNLETLKTIPKEKNIDIRKLLLDFHAKYYSANIMTLAVLGSESIDKLEKMVVPLFKDLVNKEVVVPTYKEYPYGEEELGIIMKIPSIQERKVLELQFMLPDLQEHYKSRPSGYVSHLIGHEGEGSLLSLLKKKVLVNTLSCGCNRALKGFEFFVISMNLTDEGLTRIFEIIDICFQYINMLKKEGPQLWIFNESRMLEEIKFRFKSKEKPLGYVTSLSSDMHLYLPEDVLYGPYIMDSFAPNLIVDILNDLNPLNFRCTVQSQTFEGKTDRVVQYYDAGYCLEKITKEQIEKWINTGSRSELHLPKENLFIPNDLNIVVPKEEKEIKDVPILIKDTELIRVWYKADDTFFLPKACLKLHISSPSASITPSHLNHIDIYTRLIKDELTEFAYDAELSGIRYQIDCTKQGISIQIWGFSSSQRLLLMKILEYVTKLDVKDDRFNVNKVRLEDSLKNKKLNEPYSQIADLKEYVLSENTWSSEERLQYMNDLEVGSLKRFIHEFLTCMYIECLFCGNFLIGDAKEICSAVEKVLIEDNDTRAMLPTQHLIPREYKLSKNSNYLYEQRSEIHSNSCVNVYLQVGLQEKHSNVLCELFSQMMHAPCFDTLRTKEQLGYIVFSSVSRSPSVQGFRILVQSDKSPGIVNERIEKFLETFEETMSTMPDDQFSDYVEALAVKKMEKPKKLREEADRFWKEICDKQYHYRRSEVEVEELRTLTKADVMHFFKAYISPLSKDRKKIAFVVLAKDGTSLVDDKSLNVIDDVLKFKAGLPLYPLVMPYNDVPLLSTTKSKL